MTRGVAQLGLSIRADRALGRADRAASAPVIVKGLSTTKRRRGVLQMAAYIARVEQDARHQGNAGNTRVFGSAGDAASDVAEGREAADFSLGSARGDENSEEGAGGQPDKPRRGRKPAKRPAPLPLIGKSFGEPGPGPRRRADRDDGDIAPVLRDEFGRRVDRKAIAQHLDSWRLREDGDNETPEMRAEVLAGAVLPGRKARRRLRRIQAYHLMFSAPCRNRQDVAPLELAVGELVRERFGAAGYGALQATHLEHGRYPHVHVVLQAAPPGRPALRLTPLVYDGLRADFARRLEELGVGQREAARRADRPERIVAWVSGVAEGSEQGDGRQAAGGPARASSVWRLRFGSPRRGDALRREAPGFSGRHGAEGRNRTAAAAVELLIGVAEQGSAVGKLTELLTGRFGAAAPVVARRWEELHRESPPLAEWYLRERPERLADVEQPRGSGIDEQLLAFLRARRARRRRRAASAGSARPVTPPRPLDDFGAPRRAARDPRRLETPDEVIARQLGALAHGLQQHLPRELGRLEDAQALLLKASDVLEAASLARELGASAPTGGSSYGPAASGAGQSSPALTAAAERILAEEPPAQERTKQRRPRDRGQER